MKTVIITGANSGLGFETAKKIAKNKNYQIILACRNMNKADAAKNEIIKETGNDKILTEKLDTSSLSSVREFAENFKKLNVKLYGLINNAGISSMIKGLSEDGIEIVFATNYLGHFLLTNLLLPYMQDKAKIINVSSDMHNPPGGIEWKNPELLAHPQEDDIKRYSHSKLCNIYFTYELDKRLKSMGANIMVNAFNPGLMTDTNFAPRRNKAESELVKLRYKDRVGDLNVSSSALAELMLNNSYNSSGKYFDRSTNYIDSSPLSYNKDNRLELWKQSVKLTDLKDNDHNYNSN